MRPLHMPSPHYLTSLPHRRPSWQGSSIRATPSRRLPSLPPVSLIDASWPHALGSPLLRQRFARPSPLFLLFPSVSSSSSFLTLSLRPLPPRSLAPSLNALSLVFHPLASFRPPLPASIERAPRAALLPYPPPFAMHTCTNTNTRARTHTHTHTQKRTEGRIAGLPASRGHAQRRVGPVLVVSA